MRDALVLWGCWNKLSQNEQIKTTENDSLEEVLELEVQNQGRASSKGARGGPFLASLLASGCCW